MIRYVDVSEGIATDTNGQYRAVDTAALASQGIAIVAFPGGNASPWVEREDFQGREDIPEIIEAARPLLDEADAKAQEEPGEERVPSSVSAFQAFAALDETTLGDGRTMLEAVEDYMSDPGTPRLERLAFQKARDFERDSPTVAKIASLFDLSSEQVDNLFIRADEIQA